RLINTSTRRFVDFSPDKTVPLYAILSHRWENTLKLVMLPKGRESKSGYQKIYDACSKASQLGLEYICIDTCCIDQAEIACNIKSMYAYYRNSAVCLVYLYD
ncbi:hypothetical protein K435DRAFT_636601, partial [Dendrothele bispora CBS 962.96]